MDNKQRTSRFQCKKQFVSINKNSNRFYTDILFSASCTGYKISIYLLIFEHADIHEIVEFANDFEENNPPIVSFYSFVCNLKKILALVLAFACAFTMFAGAAFTDQADIKVDTDVVDTLVSLGVVNGYDDGSFKPNGTVTRAEMAKMIYVLRTGNSDASAYNDDKTSFTDIGSHWARGYIKYCQSLGIIAGKSNTKFVPNEKVSAQEAAKMLLVTLGYDAQKAGLVGTGWASKTNALADENGLLEDVNTSFTAACPRQYAAQLIYNTIFAPTVVLRDGEYTNMKLVTGANFDTYNPTVGEKYMGLKSDTGVITSVGKETFKIALDRDEDNASGNSGNQSYTKLKKDYSSMLGQKVKVLFKKTSDVIGVFATADNHVYTTVQNALSKDGDKIKFDGTSYSVDSTINLYTVPVSGSVSKSTTSVADLVDKDSANAVVLADTDDNNKIDTVIVTEVVLAKVTYVSTKEIIAGSQSYKYEDEKIADGIVKDDYVAVSKNTFEDCKNVVKATKITGSINGTKVSGGVNKYRIDDTWYNQYSNADMNSVQVGNKIDAWVYNGVVAYAKRTAGESGKVGDVCVIKAIGSNIEGDKVKIVDFDGKESIVAYDTEDHSADGYVDPDGLKVGAVYEYEIVKNEYRFKELNTTADWYGDYTAKSTGSAATSASVGGLTVAADGNGKVEKIGTFKVNDNAKVILVTNVSSTPSATTDTKAITGKQLKTLLADGSANNAYANGGIAAFTSKVDGLTQVTYAVVGVNSVASQFDTNDNYGYITDSAYVSATGYVTYKVWTGAEEVTVTEKKSNVTGRTEGTVIGYSSINADKEIEDVAVITGIEGAIKGVNDKQTKVTFDGSTQHDITADTKVLYVDTDAHEGKTSGSIVEADKFGDAYFNNVIYKLDGDDVDLLVVDVKNKLNGEVTLNGAAPADIEAALVSGDVTVAASAITGNVTVPAGKTLTLTGTVTATELGRVKATAGAKLVVAEKTASITSSDVYTAAGSKTNETTSVAGTTLSAKVIKAGATFTGATVYTDAQLHTTVAWVVDAASMLQ